MPAVEFVEVDAPCKIVETWKADWHGGRVTAVTYRLDGFASRSEAAEVIPTTEGWERMLGWLVMPFAAHWS